MLPRSILGIEALELLRPDRLFLLALFNLVYITTLVVIWWTGISGGIEDLGLMMHGLD